MEERAVATPAAIRSLKIIECLALLYVVAKVKAGLKIGDGLIFQLSSCLNGTTGDIVPEAVRICVLSVVANSLTGGRHGSRRRLS